MTEDHAGELERFAFDQALRAARRSVFWNTHWGRFDHGFVDYFEDTAKRNLELLHGLEELGEQAARRGIVPQTQSDQAKLVTDGGREVVAAERPEKIPGGTGRFIECPNCGGDGEIVDCWDDICIAQGRCMHEGNVICRECQGDGRVWMWYSDVIEQHPQLSEVADAE